MTATLKVGDAVLVRVGVGNPDAHAGEGITCGARVIDSGPPLWIDLCMLGQHLPQMYRREEIQPIDIDVCEQVGLCPGCLGYGTQGDVPLAAGVDEVPEPCGICQGTGRAVMRVNVTRDVNSVEARVGVLPHIAKWRNGNCLACGVRRLLAPHRVNFVPACRYCSIPPGVVADHWEENCPVLSRMAQDEEHTRLGRDLVEMLGDLRKPPETSHGSRKIYVYSLSVEYPKGSQSEGWAPEDWNRDYPFYWPKLRTYLSERGANQRASMLRGYGAAVQVVRSKQVRWD